METQTQARATGSSNDLLRMRADMQDQANERDFEAGPTARRTVCNTSDVPEGNHPHSVDGKEWHCFRDETNRLLSFAKFPRTAAKSATLLANHGFVYTGVGDATDDATTCYFCGARKKKWQASDVVSSIHHPSCPMVTETHCANVPISTNRAGEELQVQGGSMHCVEKTEIQRPDQADVDVNIHLSEESASVGGCDQTPSSIKQNERPCAMFSNLTKSKSHLPEETKVATVFSHQKSFFPERKHPSKQNTSNIKHENDKPPCNKENTFILESPKSPEYVSEDSRLRTFTTWPSEHHLKPRDLSDAGFYYENTRDLVRCFHCGGRLQNWKDTSDIRVEHARWFPNCGLVRQQLGAGDSTRCYHCGGALRNWGHSHNVFVLHAKWFPNCSHMRLLMGQSFVDTVQEWRRAGENSLASLYSKLRPKEIETITAGFQKRKIPTGKELLCKMCEGSDVAIMFISCGHLATCALCGPGVEKCPVCQIQVTGRVRANF